MDDRYNLIIGSHVGMSKQDDYLLGAVKEMLKYDANTMMIYTGAPQNTRRVPVEDFHIAEFKQLLVEHNLNVNHMIVHAPYIINLANTVKPETFQLAVDFLGAEIKRVEAIGIPTIVLHPGSAVGAPRELALAQIVKGLNLVLKPDQQVKIAIETMAGKGTEVGITFDEIAYILKHVRYPELVGVCWDTCHMWDAGFDLVHQLDSIIDEFETKIGMDKLLCFHINDSLNTLASHKDRHANLGYGHLGFEALLSVIYHPRFNGIPKILETPYIGDHAPYQEEIAMIKARRWTDPFATMNYKK